MKNTENKFPFQLKPEQAKQILDIACNGWKPKLAEKWAVPIVLGNDITIDKSFYQEMRTACTADQHKLFDKIFGADNNLDSIKTFEDALALSDFNWKGYLELVETSKTLGCQISKSAIAQRKLEIIISVMNDGWTPNWKDSSELKWYPWFDLGGSGFSLGVCAYRNSSTYVGGRLCTKNEDLCKYIATTFIDIYKEYMCG